MGEIVNLNRARKARASVAAKATASANRVTHGLSKAERGRAEAEQARAQRLLDGQKRED